MAKALSGSQSMGSWVSLMVTSLCHLLLDQFLMCPPVGLHQHAIDVGDGHHFFSLSGGFDQAAITEITAQPQITLSATQYQFDGGGIKGVDPHPGRFELFDDIALHVVVIQWPDGG